MKNFFKVVFSRAVFTGAFIALQFAAVYLAITRFNEHFAIFYGVCLVLSAVVVVYLVSRDGNPAYKIAWIIPILALPVFGVLLYLVFGKNQLSLKEKARMSSVAEQYEKAMRSVPAAEPALPEHTDAKRVSDYLHRAAGAPVFTHTETTYLPVGEVYFDTLLAELEKAEKFIFMEYYIIAPGTMWNAIHEVLRRKAESGVDVRVMYDDFGCMYKLPEGYEAHVVPRSSTFKNYGLLQANSMGVVDYTYRGDNDQWRVPMYATRDVHIDKNTRISQFRIMKNQPPLVFTRVEHLTGPDRGGFGSTGK